MGVLGVVVQDLRPGREAFEVGCVVDVGAQDGTEGFEGVLGAGFAVEVVADGEVDEGVAAVQEGAEEGMEGAEVGDVEGQVHADDGVGMGKPAGELEDGVTGVRSERERRTRLQLGEKRCCPESGRSGRGGDRRGRWRGTRERRMRNLRFWWEK